MFIKQGKLTMKTSFILFLTILVWHLVVLNANSQLIVDHWAIPEFEQIPDEWIEKAKELTIHYGHTSHGSQIMAGLYWLQDNVDSEKYKVVIGPRNGSRSPALPAATNPASLRMWEEGLWPETADGHLGYWLGEAALNGTRNVLNSGEFDVSGWAWCGQVSNSDWSYIQGYINAMSTLESEYPNVKFFYMTGHNVEPGPPNHKQVAFDRLRSNNQGIKSHCQQTNGILFDFADIETHDPDGNYYPREDGTGTWCEEWLANNPNEYPNLPPRSESGCGTGCGISAHAHGLFTALKAKAFWWMMARLAGWPGVPRLSVEDDIQTVTLYGLSQNYPNPFNPSTSIHFSLAKSEEVKLEVYNILGNTVATLVDGNLNAGDHTVEFDASELSSGVYFYSITAGNFKDVKKMMVVK
jgi:hypothetical protein